MARVLRGWAGLSRRQGVHCLLWAVALVGAPLARGGEAQPPAAAAKAETAGPSHLLIVGNLAGETRTLSAKEFAALPRVSLQAKAPHSGPTTTYEGVLLKRVLEEAGIRPADPSKGGKELARPLRSAYLLIEAFDGYQVVFSLPEVLFEGGDRLLLADRRDGKPLDPNAAPYQLINATSDRHERWARQVRRVLVRPGSASPFASTAPAAPLPAAKAGPPAGLYLVGTGPGAPDLISVRGAEVLRHADLVLCYSWMKDELAPLVRPGTVEVASPLLQGGKYFGQKPDGASAEQRERVEAAHRELDKLKARIRGLVEQGKRVAIADNGDPMVFSPWSWVPEQMAELNPVIVPGMSSFNAANAALRRSVAGQDAVVLSGGGEMGSRNEEGRLSGTMVYFTHRAKLEEILPELRRRYPADTPVGIVCDASYPTQKVVYGTLATILDELRDKKLPHLYLVYVGDGLKPGACCPDRKATGR